jgi:alpha-L-arabinofuranosidase
MRFITSVVILASLVFVSFMTRDVYAQTPVTINVNPSSQIRDTNKLIFGHSFYHTMLNESGKSPDTFAPLLDEVGSTVVRFPGGLFSDIYHWFNAIGPFPLRSHVCGAQNYDPETFSMHDFLNVAEKAGNEIIYTVNEDRGEPAEARDFIEYTNAPLTLEIKQRAISQRWTVDMWRRGLPGSDGYLAGSMSPGYYAWLRSQPGYGEHEKPWGIKYWEIGNEVFAPYCPIIGVPQCDNFRIGCPSPGRYYNTITPHGEDSYGGVSLYIQRLAAFADALRSVDPNIKIGAVGFTFCAHCGWSKAIMTSSLVNNKVDFIVEHPYLPNIDKGTATEEQYTQAMISGTYVEKIRDLGGWESLFATCPTCRLKKLGVTEHAGYFPWENEFDTQFRLTMVTAGRLMNYIQTPFIELATFWFFRTDGLYHSWRSNPEPTAGPTNVLYKFFTSHVHDKLVTTTVQNNPTHQTAEVHFYYLPAYTVPDIDAVSTVSSDGKKLSVIVMNRNIARSHNLQLNIGSFPHTWMTQESFVSGDTGMAGLLMPAVGTKKASIGINNIAHTGSSVNIQIAPYSLNSFEFSTCNAISAPVNLKPQTSVVAGVQSITWDPVPGAMYYSLRVDDMSNPWTDTCDIINPGDICDNRRVATSFPYDFKEGRTYQIWIHSRNNCGNWTESTISVVRAQNSFGYCTGRGDFDCDGDVDLTDLTRLLQNFGKNEASVDTNGDGIINLQDLGNLLSNFGSL